MTDTERIAQLQAENAYLRKSIDELETERNEYYADYQAAKARLKALASYLDNVEDAVKGSVVSQWKRKSLTEAVQSLASGAKARLRPLHEEHPNDTFRSAWAILQWWDSELDHDPKEFKDFKRKYTTGVR